MTMFQPAAQSGLQLRERCWYGWQLIGPGGLSAPWRASPIFVESVTPLKTGKGLLRVTMLVLLRPFAPKRLEVSLKVRWHDRQLIIADWQAPGEPPGLVAINEVDREWVRQHCAAAVNLDSAEVEAAADTGPVRQAAQTYLSQLFGATPDAILAGAAAARPQWPPWPKSPRRTGTIEVGWSCHGIAAYRLLKGFVPLCPEDRWYIYRDGDQLIFQRGATGIAVWRARIEVTIAEVTVHSLTVLLDRRHYSYGAPTDELAQFNFVVRLLLMGEEATPPSYADIAPLLIAEAWRPHLDRRHVPTG